MFEPPSRLSLGALSGPSGFRIDSRYGLGDMPMPAPPMAEEPVIEADPLAEAFAQGFAAGAQQARDLADVDAALDAAAHHMLALSFARMDKALEEELRLRLRDTVAALCEAAIAPLALDEDLLMRRIGVAVSMLARADDDRVIRLHPDDLKLVSERLLADWTVEPDPTLERGELRVEGATGGVEDGPAMWRRAIAEALHQC